jgi:serpin B
MNRRFPFLGVVLLGLLAFGLACVKVTNNTVATEEQDDFPQLAAGDPKDVKAAADGIAAFTADLYAKVRADKTGNLIVSPYSISTALAMTAAGAKGNTFDEMQKVLRLPAFDKIGSTYGTLGSEIVKQPKNARSKPEIVVANSIWAQTGYPWKQEFKDHVGGGFQARVYDADFTGDSQGSRQRINDWVKRRTKERITDLIPTDELGADTRMVLANAIYFKARWVDVFEPYNTKPADFTLLDGTKVQAPLMHQMKYFRLLESDDLQVLQLPYEGVHLSMFVILPRKADGLPEIEKALTPEKLQEWTDSRKLEYDAVKVWLPKFQFTVPLRLNTPLQSLGIKDAFDPMAANFKGMTDSDEALFIGNVFHKAFIEVDEEGTKAAAATAVDVKKGEGPDPAEKMKEFRADRPFLFVIKHTNGTVLFIGRVEDPTK